jgi:hypothetical protein
MKKSIIFSAGVVCLLGTAAVLISAPQNAQSSAQGEPVNVVVTLEPKHGNTIPPVTTQDITVQEAREKRPVTNFVSLRGDVSTQLALLIDDSARGTFGTEITVLQQFINSLSANTEVAVGYMRNGTVDYTQHFTRDHAAAANSIRVAFGPGGADVSPFDSLSELAKKWPKTGAQRRIVVMISSGIENLGGGIPPENPYVNAGIQDAQRAGLTVYTIYSPSVGHAGHSYWRNISGTDFLSQVSDETGGESYYEGFGSPVSFQPFLDQIKAQMQNQYLLTFTARPENKAGLQPVKISVIDKDASVAAPDRIFVNASL